MSATMITAAQAEQIVGFNKKLKGLRETLKLIDESKAADGHVKVTMRMGSGWGNDKELSAFLDPKQAAGLVRASFQRSADECVRALNRLGAEVPK